MIDPPRFGAMKNKRKEKRKRKKKKKKKERKRKRKRRKRKETYKTVQSDPSFFIAPGRISPSVSVPIEGALGTESLNSLISFCLLNIKRRKKKKKKEGKK